MVKRPFLWYTGAYVLGEVLALYGPGMALALGGILLYAGHGKYGQSKRFLFALPFFFLAGMFLAGNAGRAPALDAIFEDRGETELSGKLSGKVVKLEKREGKEVEYRIWLEAVSYTHLTLPTKA